jgi:hypothetical protein
VGPENLAYPVELSGPSVQAAADEISRNARGMKKVGEAFAAMRGRYRHSKSGFSPFRTHAQAKVDQRNEALTRA